MVGYAFCGTVLLVLVFALVQIQRHDFIVDTYGSSEIYSAIRWSTEFELYRVTNGCACKEPLIPPTFPQVVESSLCGVVPLEQSRLLRAILSDPNSFYPMIRKSFFFNPTAMLRFKSEASTVDVYLCFKSNKAAIVVDGKKVQSLSLDKVASELNDLISAIKCSS
jgi:hypothetical protein